jgi:hypothetical protein
VLKKERHIFYEGMDADDEPLPIDAGSDSDAAGRCGVSKLAPAVVFDRVFEVYKGELWSQLLNCNCSWKNKAKILRERALAV